MVVAKDLDHANTRTRQTGEGLQRNVVTIRVRRRLAHVSWRAENAAHGEFPLHPPIPNQKAHWQFANGALPHRLEQRVDPARQGEQQKAERL